MIQIFTLIICFISLILSASMVSAAKEEVNIYSSQKQHLIRPILDEFEKETGIKVNLATGGKSELVSRLAFEKENTPADLLLTVDIGNIYTAKEKGLLQAIESKKLNSQIPANLRDPEGFWYGATIRARAIYYNQALTDAAELKNYEDLADPQWKGKLLIRSSSNVYNQSLVAFMLAKHGEEKTLEWAKGIIANMARPPQGGDSDQLRALAAGEGEIAVANTYYYGRMISGDDSQQDEAVQKNVKIILPNQNGKGAHVNIRGGGVTKYAKNKENAIRLLEYLTTDKAQTFFTKENFEYPAKPSVRPHEVVQEWGEIKRHPINLEEIGKLNKQAITIMDKAGWK